MNVALLFPTGTDPRSPYLALPCLAASLRNAGINTRLFDLDITGLHALLEPENLKSAGAELRRRAKEDSASWRLARLSESLPSTAPAALAVLRDPVKFYSPNEFNTARETVYDALDLVSAAAGPVHYSISPIRYDADGVDPHSLTDLIAATASDRLNLFAPYWERDVYPVLERERPLFTGIAINNRQQLLPGLLLARRLKERGYFTVIGGALFTKLLEQLKQLPGFFELFASVVIGYEGETAMLALADSLANDRPLADVPNLLYLENGNVRANKTHVENVEKLPVPDFAGLPLDKYLTPEPVFPVYFGKGCYFNRCKFCDIPYINHISNKAYRLRSVEQIVTDLLELKSRFGCRHFEITDEALPPRFLEHLAEALEPHESERFSFVGYARLERGFTRENCRKFARMGLRKIFFGLESGDQGTLDHMDKDIQVADVPGILGNCRDANIHFHIFSIIGFPQESERSARETYAFFERNAEVLDHPGNSFDIHPFGLELRTAYFNQAAKMGALILPRALAKDFVIGVGTDWFNTFGLTHEEVRRLIAEFQASLKRIFARYHAAPEHLWPGFEEYSVLYADHYLNHEFPYRTNLPGNADLEEFRVRLSPGIATRESGQQVLLKSRKAEMEIERSIYVALRNPGARTAADLIRELSGETGRDMNAIRGEIDELISGGLVQLEPQFENRMAGARV